MGDEIGVVNVFMLMHFQIAEQKNEFTKTLPSL